MSCSGHGSREEIRINSRGTGDIQNNGAPERVMRNRCCPPLESLVSPAESLAHRSRFSHFFLFQDRGRGAFFLLLFIFSAPDVCNFCRLLYRPSGASKSITNGRPQGALQRPRPEGVQNLMTTPLKTFSTPGECKSQPKQ